MAGFRGAGTERLLGVVRGFCVGAVALGVFARPVEAREEPLGMLLEPTYALPFPMFIRGGESPVSGAVTRFPATLEASINLHVPLTSSLAELDRRDGFAHGFIFIPRVDLRHGLGTSFPIRTPGFRPTVRFQFFVQRQPRPGVRRRLLGELLVAHHSNGQDGCLYRDQRRVPGKGCQFPEGQTDSGAQLNHRDGSFAANELGIRAGGEWRVGPPEAAWSFTSLLGVVLFRPTVGGLDAETEAIYGTGRGEAQFRVAKRVLQTSRARPEVGVRLSVEQRWGRGAVRRPTSVLVDLFLRSEASRDWGPFLRAYWGGDYYNVRFDASILTLGLGLMWKA